MTSIGTMSFLVSRRFSFAKPAPILILFSHPSRIFQSDKVCKANFKVSNFFCFQSHQDLINEKRTFEVKFHDFYGKMDLLNLPIGTNILIKNPLLDWWSGDHDLISLQVIAFFDPISDQLRQNLPLPT
jgi:hypothetical protein